jgi:ankyrin repeat protein
MEFTYFVCFADLRFIRVCIYLQTCSFQGKNKILISIVKLNMKKYLFVLLVLFMSIQARSQYVIDLTKIEAKEAIESYTGDVNVVDKNGATALMWAIYYSDLDMVKLLLSKGANPYLKGHIYLPQSGAIYGGCMAVAAGQNKLEIIKYLIEGLKIPVDDRELGSGKEEDGWTALQWAAFNGNNDIISYLVKRKAKINALSDNDGDKTALYFAVQNGHFETVELLVKLKAKLNIKTAYGDTPLDAALQSENKEIASFLFSKGAKSSVSDKDKVERRLTEMKPKQEDNNQGEVEEFLIESE